jgi:hypothetical protein
MLQQDRVSSKTLNKLLYVQASTSYQNYSFDMAKAIKARTFRAIDNLGQSNYYYYECPFVATSYDVVVHLVDLVLYNQLSLVFGGVETEFKLSLAVQQ